MYMTDLHKGNTSMTKIFFVRNFCVCKTLKELALSTLYSVVLYNNSPPIGATVVLCTAPRTLYPYMHCIMLSSAATQDIGF